MDKYIPSITLIDGECSAPCGLSAQGSGFVEGSLFLEVHCFLRGQGSWSRVCLMLSAQGSGFRVHGLGL
eukprot:2093712-Rhodomonas_salina.1